MGIVNADSNSLLQVLHNLNTALSDIERTRSSIQLKYRQLGSNWNDKKYKDLGDIVFECNKALASISHTLSLGQKAISQLAQSLQEYENTSLGGEAKGDNGFFQGSHSVALPTGGNVSYQYCLGVLTKGTIPEGYLNVLETRRQSAEEPVRRVFDNFTSQLNIKDTNYPSNLTPHYSPISSIGHGRGVYYNADADMCNPRGAGTTYYHELAHMIDHASMGFSGNLSNSEEFRNALLEDGQRILDVYNSLSPERQTMFLNRIRQDSAHSFSDLIDATTSGQIRGSYGHSREYWMRQGNLQAEAFAHFFEASMGRNDKLELLSNFFPTAFGMFRNMIDSIQPDVYERVLERSR